MAEDRLIRSIDELPIALTVPEAARVLRVSKNKLYDPGSRQRTRARRLVPPRRPP
jgi:hypothetical protein